MRYLILISNYLELFIFNPNSVKSNHSTRRRHRHRRRQRNRRSQTKSNQNKCFGRNMRFRVSRHATTIALARRLPFSYVSSPSQLPGLILLLLFSTFMRFFSTLQIPRDPSKTDNNNKPSAAKRMCMSKNVPSTLYAMLAANRPRIH